MNVSFRRVTNEHVQKFLAWRYPPPYDVYNLDAEPSSAEIAYSLDPQYQYHVMLDDAGAVLAFCSFGADGRVPGGDYSDDALDIGMGLRPDLTGQGRGIDYVQRVIGFALDMYAPNALRVTIAAFNQRAQTVWKKAGFVEVSRFGRARDQMPFIIYVRRVHPRKS